MDFRLVFPSVLTRLFIIGTLTVNILSGNNPDSIGISHLPGFVSSVIVPDVNPQDIYQWLRNMDNQRFKDWHAAHKEYRIVRKTPEYIGSRIFFKEVIDGFTISGTWEVITAQPPDLLTFKRVRRPVYWRLSLNLLENRGTLVRNEMRYGTGWRWLDNFLIGIVQRWYFTPEIQAAIDKHDQEEFLLLGEIIQNQKSEIRNRKKK